MSAVENTARGTHHVSHWFDGFAHAHKFDIIASEDGKSVRVSYSSRRQSDDYIAEVQKKGWRTGVSFAQRADPCVGIFSKTMSVFRSHQSNNNVVLLPNFPAKKSQAPSMSGHKVSVSSLYASTDNAVLQEIHPGTLEPLGFTKQIRLHPELKGPMSCSHAQRDPATGDWFNYNLEPGRTPTYRVFRVNCSSGKTDILATITGTDIAAAYMHSFFLTENYVVLCIPVTHIAWHGAKVLWEGNVLDAMEPFDATKQCRWIVVDRSNGQGEVARFNTPASFFFHSVNAFEVKTLDAENNERVDICLDYVRYDTTNILHHLYYDVLVDRDDATKKSMGNKQYKDYQARLTRHSFRLPLHGAKQTKKEAETAQATEVMCISAPHAGEMPTINPLFACKQHRYVYSVVSRGLSTFSDCIVKTDMETGDALIWSPGFGHTPGEPIFIERPGAESEDDGVLLSIVLDGSARTSYMLCLAAQTMEEMGRAETEFAIALGFHGFHAEQAL